MKNHLTMQERDWIEKYGDLPEDRDALISLIKDTHRIDMDRYESEKRRICSMKWKEISFSLPIVPKSTDRKSVV